MNCKLPAGNLCFITYSTRAATKIKKAFFVMSNAKAISATIHRIPGERNIRNPPAVEFLTIYLLIRRNILAALH